jgi:hypothetical protein
MTTKEHYKPEIERIRKAIIQKYIKIKWFCKKYDLDPNVFSRLIHRGKSYKKAEEVLKKEFKIIIKKEKRNE